MEISRRIAGRGSAPVIAAALLLALFADPASPQTYIREELRIPTPEAGARGLEALLVRADLPGRHPLILLNHGSPRQADARREMTPLTYLPHAIEFARRGWTVVTVMRRGYGNSAGAFAEGIGSCGNPDYARAGATSAVDLRAALVHLSKRSDVDPTRMLSIGQSAGGLATVALSADPPSGLVAGINFAGGRGSQADDEICREERLVEAMRGFGRRSRLPMLWVYTENDRYFGPEVSRRMHGAFTSAGGNAEFVLAPPFGRDGHTLFSPGGIPQWTPHVDKFLARQNLVLRREPLPPPAAPALTPPPQLSSGGREAFERYLAAAPHKAFAVSPRGAYGWRSSRRTIGDAKDGALDNCRKTSSDCRIVAVDDTQVP
jgi:dienelactone hydrolase